MTTHEITRTHIRIDNIPGQLKHPKQWVVWRLQPDKGGKMTKVPFGARVAEVRNRVDAHATYGVLGNYDEATGEFDYIAGLNVNPAADVPEGIASWDVPAQTYAVFTFTLPTIGATYEHIHGTWLPASGYQHADGPEFELYDEAFDPNDPESLMYIYIPIEK